MEACFGGRPDGVEYFLVAMEQFLRRWSYQFANEGEANEYISGCFDGIATQWDMDIYRLRAPELGSCSCLFNPSEHSLETQP